MARGFLASGRWLFFCGIASCHYVAQRLCGWRIACYCRTIYGLERVALALVLES